MATDYWENCPLHQTGQCPQELAIDKVSLVPQVLPPSEVEAARAICQRCGKRLGEKRKHRRTKRPLESVLFSGEGTPIQRNILDISAGGALVQPKERVQFREGERVRLEIYPPSPTSSKSAHAPISFSGLVKRVDVEKGRLAIVFLAEGDH